VSFVTPRDPDYLRVKRIKPGECGVDPVYDAFIGTCCERYGVSPLAILLDAVIQPRGQGRTPRLGVVLERTFQYSAFVRGPFRPEKYKQQAVAIMFAESVRRGFSGLVRVSAERAARRSARDGHLPGARRRTGRVLFLADQPPPHRLNRTGPGCNRAMR
jgi:hypothetical protein